MIQAFLSPLGTGLEVVYPEDRTPGASSWSVPYQGV